MDATMSVPLSVAQAAVRAGVSTKTIRRWLGGGRLEATRGIDGAWLIDPEALEQARLTPGQSTDSPTLHAGHGPVQSMVQDLLDRLERQSQRIGQLEAELAEARRALPAPDTSVGFTGSPPRNGTVEPTQTPSEATRRAWWRLW